MIPNRTGLDTWAADGFAALRGKRVGAIVNPTSVDSQFRHLADMLAATKGLTLQALFGPEHGVRGEAQYMVAVDDVSKDPRTGVPGVDPPDGWDQIPGARGCTPQSCAFRDHFDELKRLGVAHLYGLSTQTTAYQKEAVTRLHLPFALLSDERLAFAKVLNLPTFSVAAMTLLKRMALIIDDGRITKVFYPVFPPDKNAAEVVAWLEESR